jgi:pSer/pThr/pTyr-binding forkhead associated (FHA) protein
MMGRREEVRILTAVKDGRTYALTKLPVLVGKPGQDVDIVLNDPSVSRLHAKFFEESGKIYLEDLNSTNGCTLNYMPLQANETVELASGDRISIGEVEFIYGKADR